MKAQTQENNFIKELIESFAENLPEDYDLSELEDRLNFFKKHPINLNSAGSEDLSSLVFLTPIQINNLFLHIKMNGKLIDVLELQSIQGFDLKTIETLLPFVAIKTNDLLDKITIKNILAFGESELVLRAGRVLEKPKGFNSLLESHYLGSRERFLSRYKFNYSNRISASVIFEKDAGEPFMNKNTQLPFDFRSVSLAFKHIGPFKKLIIGDYSLQFGQGLALWSGFAFGKAPDITSLVKRDLGLNSYSSANEYSFFRGIATTLSIAKHIEFTAFGSLRSLDASLSLNIENEDILNTLNQTGLHRTTTEIENKGSTSQKIYGGNVEYQFNTLNIGILAYHSIYGNSFVTGLSPYKYYGFSGKKLTNIGLNYAYAYKNIYLFGELGESSNRAIAYLNGAIISLSPKVSSLFLYRNYGIAYHNFFNQGIGESSDASNENGFYMGLHINPTKRWLISLYADYFKFPWLKFRIDAPSDGHEILGQLTYSPTKTFKVMLRFKSEIKQQNTELEVPINFLEEVKRASYRADVAWKFNRSLNFQNRVELSQFKKGTGTMEIGYLVYQDIAYSPLFSKIAGNVRIAYFNTPSYNSRIYAYEDDVLYNFTFGLYNGKGIRSYLNLKYKLIKKLDLWARYSVFWYTNLNKVGSGLDEIAGHTKSDVKLQMRYQF